MKKFDGVLLVTDYDDTLYSRQLHVPEKNRAAIRYFIDQGGRFTIATGRVYSTFTPQIALEQLQLNAPVVLGNGSAVYDYQKKTYLVRTTLPSEIRGLMHQLCAAFPELAFETYHGDQAFAHNPNLVTQRHLERVGSNVTVCPVIDDIPLPWGKVILEQDEPYLQEVQRYFMQRWGEDYEVIFSTRYLLEVTNKGVHKGGMVSQVARHLGVHPSRVYCIGDNLNDISMLACSAIPFAPANCAQAVRDWGARILCHCDDGAVAQAISILDEIYSQGEVIV